MQVGASNELPESEELDALYDRFLIRRHVSAVAAPRLRELARIAAGAAHRRRRKPEGGLCVSGARGGGGSGGKQLPPPTHTMRGWPAVNECVCLSWGMP